MDIDQTWRAIDAQRLRVAALLDTVTGDEWERPSLCAGWTVRDVTAHLTMQQLRLREAVAMFRVPGTMNTMIREAARRRAATVPTDQLIAQIRAMVGARRHNVGVTPGETLIDILVHGLDIAVPLGRDLEIPTGAAAAAATRMWTMRWPRPIVSPRRFAGLRLAATDADWSVGTGALVEAPMTGILLLLAGRSAARPLLAGPGTSVLAGRLP